MKRTFAVVTVALFLVAPMILAQAPPSLPKPGPEVKKLDHFVGTWTIAGDSKASPFGPAGKFSGTEHNEWIMDGHFLLSHNDSKTSMGDEKGLSVMGYDADGKTYIYQSFDNSGMWEQAKGAVDGDTWTWLSEDKINGKLVKGRYTVKVLSPTSHSFKFELANDAGEYSTIMEGKATRNK